MTAAPDFNDGKWHGWNGGECPVDPQCEVEVRYDDFTYDGIAVGAKAKDYLWDKLEGASICAFRVTKPAPAKPREWWTVGAHMHTSEANAQAFLAELNANHPEMNFGPITHVREVLP